MKPSKTERFQKSEVDEELYADMQLWVFQLAEDSVVKPRGVSLLAKSNGGEKVSGVAFDPEDRTWRKLAACRGSDMEIFYPKKGHSPLPAYSICCDCSVRMECLGSSLGEPFGIWGGFSERERRGIKRAVKEGASLEEAIEPYEKKKSRKLDSAILRNSPALYHKGVKITPEDL